MEDFAGICLFFYSFNMILREGHFPGFLIFTAILILYIIKYIRMKNLISQNKKRIDKQKDFFIETITHDFKVPTIAQLRGTELLKNGTFGELNKEQLNLIIQIEDSCNYVLDMISMFSKANEIEKKTYILDYEKFNMSEIVILCLNSLSKKAQEKNITFEYHTNDDDTSIEGDKAEIQKVILNLLSSAINYSKLNGHINIDLDINADKLVTNISGMELLHPSSTNFDRYTTVGQSLCLYLCKKIIELHKGKMYFSHVKNNLKGVAFSLPRTNYL